MEGENMQAKEMGGFPKGEPDGAGLFLMNTIGN